MAFALLLAFQRPLLYSRASRSTWQELSTHAKEMGLEPWLGYGEKKIPIGFKKTSSHSKYRCLVLHGNAKDALFRLYYVRGLEQFNSDWDIYLLEYPGYGWRGGNPSQDKLVSEAIMAWKELQKEDPTKPTFIFGESLGAAVACQMARKISNGQDYVNGNGKGTREYPLQISGIFLITPFNHLAEAAQNHFKVFPIQYFMVDAYDSDQAIQSYRGPVAVMLAENDFVVPARIGQKLYDAYEGGPKKLWIMKNAGHNTIPRTPEQPWWHEVVEFLTEPTVQTQVHENKRM